MTISALYEGAVIHQRLTPKEHRLRYRMFQALFDLDELSGLAARLKHFAHNRFALFSFHDRDHGDGAGSLRPYVERLLGEAGLDLGGGPIQLLCLPRILGHVFNPLSIYYCHHADGRLGAMLYEVNNTFGDRHSYLIPAAQGESGAEAGEIRQSADKRLYVSPFMDLDMVYDFRLTLPGERISTVIQGLGPDGALIIAASFQGRRRDLTDATLLRAFFAYPLMTLKVVAAIHWEAVRIFLKGVRFRPRPKAGPAVSIGR